MDRITIEMEGTPRNFHFGTGFIGEVIEKLNIGFEQLQGAVNANPYKTIPVMLYESHRWACVVDNVECDMRLADMVTAIDAEGGVGGEKVLEFLRAFGKSRTKDVPAEAKKTRPKTTRKAKK